MLTLTSDPTVSVNCVDAEDRRTPFYRASFYGHTAIVKHLLGDARVDVNKQQVEGACPLGAACQEGHHEVVALLLADPRVVVNPADADGMTPFWAACCYNHGSVVGLMLEDLRVDINLHDGEECTPLWVSAMSGNLGIVQRLLASERPLDVKKRSQAGDSHWNKKNACEIAQLQTELVREEFESEEEYEQVMRYCPEIAALLSNFMARPQATRTQLRVLPGLRDPFVGRLFALVVLLSDDFVGLKRAGNPKVKRFFKMACRLPMELQMVLCNRAYGSARDLVRTATSEPAFKKYCGLATW